MSIGSVSWGTSPWDPVAAAQRASSPSLSAIPSSIQTDSGTGNAGGAATLTASSAGNALLMTLLQLQLDPQSNASSGDGAPPAGPASPAGLAGATTGADAASADGTTRTHHGHHHHHAAPTDSASGTDTASSQAGDAAASSQDSLTADVAGILKQLSRVLDAYATNGATSGGAGVASAAS